jgi:cytochrome oxidase Cu insertion factor (SCO1/SenC/PrrC family)
MPDRRLRLLGVFGVAAVVGASAGVGAGIVHGSGRAGLSAGSADRPQAIRAQVRWDAGEKVAPVFALRDQAGKRLSLGALRGRPVVLTFLDSVCKRECPVEGRVLSDVEREARPTGMAVVVVSVDPWSETPATVRAFTRRVRWSGRWYWFLGSARLLRPVWQAYGIEVRRIPRDVAHSVALYVIDPRGDLRAGYLFPFSPSDVVHDVQALAASAGGSS